MHGTAYVSMGILGDSLSTRLTVCRSQGTVIGWGLPWQPRSKARLRSAGCGADEENSTTTTTTNNNIRSVGHGADEENINTTTTNNNIRCVGCGADEENNINNNIWGVGYCADERNYEC